MLDHRIDGLLQLEDFASHVDGDFLREVAVGHGDRHFGDISHLCGQVAGHLIDRIGEFFPHAAGPFDLGLAAKLAFRADFACDARDLGGEDRQLLDHLIDQLCTAKEFAFERPSVFLQCHGLTEVAFADCADGTGDLGRRGREVVDQRVERLDLIRPPTGDTRHRQPLPQPPFLPDDAGNADNFLCPSLAYRENIVHRVGHLPEHTCPCGRQPHGEISIAVSHHDVKNFAKLLVDILPSAGSTMGGDRRIFESRSLLLIALVLHCVPPAGKSLNRTRG